MGWFEAIPDDVVAAVGCLAALGVSLLTTCVAYHLRMRRVRRPVKMPVFRTARDAPAAGPS